MHKPHIEMNELDTKKKKSLANRLLVAGILLAVGVPCIFLGGWFWFAFVSLALIVAIWEILHATNKKYHPLVHVVTYISVISFVYWFLIKYNVQSYRLFEELGRADQWEFSLEDHYEALYISPYGLCVCLGFYVFWGIVRHDFDWHDVTYLFTMSFLIGIGFQSLLYVRYVSFAVGFNGVSSSAWPVGLERNDPRFLYGQSVMFLVFVFCASMLNDAWAYFVGMLFGKHKMAPRISPSKTWEGFFGGWILGAISSWAIIAIADANGVVMLPAFRIFGEGSQWWWSVILALVLPLIGDLGDLSFSFIKRFYGIKDYSKVLGAHGGILDRADSLTFCAILASIFATFVNGGWDFFG